MPQLPTIQSPPEKIGEEELLMRRVFLRKEHYRKSKLPPLQDGVFWPSPGDVDGLSLSRRHSEMFPQFLTEWQFKAACRHKDSNLRENCGVCGVLVKAARTIGLQVCYDPSDDDPGHVYLPEITYSAFQGSKEERDKILTLIGQLLETAHKNMLIVPGTQNPTAGS